MSLWKKLEVERVEHTSPQAVIFRIAGTLTDTKEAFSLLDEIREEVRKMTPLIVLNLAQIERMTSAGVGIIAAAYTSTQRDGGKLVLAQATERSEQLLALVGLWAQIAHVDTEEAALR